MKSTKTFLQNYLLYLSKHLNYYLKVIFWSFTFLLNHTLSENGNGNEVTIPAQPTTPTILEYTEGLYFH